MWTNFALIVALATTALSSPLASRDEHSDLTALTSTVKMHTANINHTLAMLPVTNMTRSGWNSSNPNITAEFKLIAKALSASSETLGAATKRSLPLFGAREAPSTVAARSCDATCQQAAYNDLGMLTAEISYTVVGCIGKNAVDFTSSSSVLIKVVEALDAVTSQAQDWITGAAGIVVQTLQEALGTDIGGTLATFISP